LEELDRLNREPFQKLPGSRLSVFLETEKDALRPLPASRFEYAEWKTVKAGMDYHVEFDGRYLFAVPEYHIAASRYFTFISHHCENIRNNKNT